MLVVVTRPKHTVESTGSLVFVNGGGRAEVRTTSNVGAVDDDGRPFLGPDRWLHCIGKQRADSWRLAFSSP